jgi:uncharacterized protein YaiE (UPF0345 family)
MAIPTPAQTIIDPNSDPALSVYGDAAPGTITTGNVTINITNVEEVTRNTIINQTLNNAAGGTNSTVQFNLNNQLVGDSGLTYDPNSDSLTVAGTITAGQFAGSGAQLTNVQGTQVVGPVSLSSSATVAEYVSNAIQANITSVGTLSTLNVSGNADINSVKTNSLLYANGEPWIFDLGTGNILFAGSLLYSESNSTISISPSYQENAWASINIPGDSDALGNDLTITNEVNGVNILTGQSNSNLTFNWNFNNVGTTTLPGLLVFSNTPGAIMTDSANNIVLVTSYGNTANSVSTTLIDGGAYQVSTANTNYQWEFDETGNLTLPADNPTIIGGGVAGIDSLGTINLIPDGSLATDQYIIVDPTAPNHIHLRAGGTGDASTADLFLGAEETFVQVSDSTGTVTVSTKDGVGNTFSYQFTNDGSLTVPNAVSATGNISGASLSVSGNVDASNLLTSGVMSAGGNISGGNLSISGNINAGNLIGDGSNLTNLPSQLGNFEITTNTLSVNNNSLDINIQTASANAGTPNGQDINLTAANGFDTGIGGEVNITAGNGGANGTGQGGAIAITAGNGTVDSLAGSITITAGQNDGTGDAGSITLYAGVAEDGDGGDIVISAAGSNNGTGGDVTISAGGSNTAANGVITLTTDGTENYVFSGTVLELPTSNIPSIQAVNTYPSMMAYGSGSHGGPELNWLDNDDPANNFSNLNTIRNTLYLNESQFYVGFNENGNATPTFAGAFTIDAADGLVTAPVDMSVIGNLAAGNITTIGSGGNITGANVVSANLFQGNLSALGNVEGNIIVGAYLYGDGSNITGVTSTGFANGNSNIGIINNANINFSSAGVANVVVITDTGANVAGYVDATYFVGDGANLTNLSVTLANLDNGNSNVVVTANGNVTITSSANATMVVTDTGANVTGYVDATYFVGDGANLTGIALSIIDNGNSNVVVNLDSDIQFSSNGNLTMSITDTGANVTGYVDATYFVGDGANITGITLANLDNGNSNVVVTANGNVTITSSANATMTVTDTGANVTGYVDATYFVGDGANITGITLANLDNGNSNIVITANANITFTSSANAIMTITDTGANVTGYANITANANVGNLGTGGIITATGNITGAKVAATYAVQLPVYADATARDAAVTAPSAGMLVFNTADGFQGYDGSAWGNITLT